MTELRHDRPLFRYLDNLRRENKSVSRTSLSADPKFDANNAMPRRLLRPPNAQAYARHLASFEALSDQSKNAIGQLFDDANSLMEARIEYIQSIGSGKRTGKRKERYDEAYSSLRVACAAYNIRCKSELRDGKSPTREWFAKLRVVMGAEWINFEEIDELIKETR